MYKYLKRITGKKIGRKRVRRLMHLMGVEAIYPRRRTTSPGGPSGIFPYKLRGLDINRPNQVWCADITFIPMHRGFMYLFTIMDWYSRKVIAWQLSNSLDTAFCLRALKRALQTHGTPEIMNTRTKAVNLLLTNGEHAYKITGLSSVWMARADGLTMSSLNDFGERLSMRIST